jgi:DNA-binding NtrC family response regulator
MNEKPLQGLVLIIEDELLLGRNIKAYLQGKGLQAETADTLKAARAKLSALAPDLVLLDHNLPDGLGLTLIPEIKAKGAKVVMLTAVGGVKLAVEAMKAGADDYLSKPVSLEELSLLAGKLIAQAQIENRLAYYQDRDAQGGGLEAILGESTAIATLRKRVEQLLLVEQRQTEGVPPAVLVRGESGTGKELVARAIHFSGPRRMQPFIELNCAALPKDLIESELFGHEKGAFTDAKERKQGLLLAADGGTLFLDEVAELPLAAQAKLLKVIEDHVVRPVGSTHERKVNVRFVSATNADLATRAKDGTFRADLMYRLAAIEITSPPLRDRDGDAVRLAQKFFADLTRRYGRADLKLSAEALSALSRHPWPGNVRELRNVIEQAVLLTPGTVVTPEDLNLRAPPPMEHPVTARSLPENEKQLIVSALEQARGNVTDAAATLGISRDTLRYRMERLGLSRDMFSGRA